MVLTGGTVTEVTDLIQGSDHLSRECFFPRTSICPDASQFFASGRSRTNLDSMQPQAERKPYDPVSVPTTRKSRGVRGCMGVRGGGSLHAGQGKGEGGGDIDGLPAQTD